MSLTLHVDTGRWRTHLDSYAAALPDGVDLVPVTKGNGYGFGNAVLAAEAGRLGATTVAVGTYAEVAGVAEAFSGDVLVLTPWRPGGDGTSATSDDPRAGRLIHTLSRAADVDALAGAAANGSGRVVIEVLTSMRRHGVAPDTIASVIRTAVDAGLTVEGIALHLPLAGDHTDEAIRLGRTALDAAATAGVQVPSLWVSHLTPAAAGQVAAQVGIPVRLRVATALWLGDRGALQARATVLDVHQVRRGDRIGYRQRRVGRDGHLIVVGGGTAHGIALEAPTAASTLRQRGVAMARGILDAGGRALSPFRVAGRQRWFAEPPHMQCSLILLPGDATSPRIGDEVDVDVRFTTTSFDDVVWR